MPFVQTSVYLTQIPYDLLNTPYFLRLESGWEHMQSVCYEDNTVNNTHYGFLFWFNNSKHTY